MWFRSYLEWSSGFSYFLQFKSEFGNKEFMIWATVSSQSCFCWLYRASPSLAAKNIVNLTLVLTIWWCPCVESSLVLLEEVFAMTSAFSSQNSISLCPASFHIPRPNLPVTPGIHIAFLHYFYFWIVLFTASCTMVWTTVHSFSGTLPDLIPWV